MIVYVCNQCKEKLVKENIIYFVEYPNGVCYFKTSSISKMKELLKDDFLMKKGYDSIFNRSIDVACCSHKKNYDYFI